MFPETGMQTKVSVYFVKLENIVTSVGFRSHKEIAIRVTFAHLDKPLPIHLNILVQLAIIVN
jgi:hypothetical protein